MSEQQVISILGRVLQLGERGRSIGRSTLLLGGLPEFDSMAVISVLQAIEEEFGFFVGDDDVTAATFESVGTLIDFVDTKLKY